MKNGRWEVVLNDDPSWVHVEAFQWETLEGWIHFTKFFSKKGYKKGKGLLMLSVPVDRVKYIRLVDAGSLNG